MPKGKKKTKKDTAFIPQFKLVFDASSLINIERNRQMKFLRKRRKEVVLPEKVANEVKKPRFPLQTFIQDNPGVIASLDHQEKNIYLGIIRQQGMHEAESAAIAIAINRNLPLIIDEGQRKARGKAQNHGVQCFSSTDFVRGVV